MMPSTWERLSAFAYSSTDMEYWNYYEIANNFMEEKALGFTGRSASLSKIEEFVESSDRRNYLVIQGPTGSLQC